MVYLPPVFTETRAEVLIAHLERHDFGLLISHGATGLMASHIPFLVERAADGLHLLGHLARPNPQVSDLAGPQRTGAPPIEDSEVLTIFTGPHAYISPGWYTGGPAVPTWNYVDVHAYGSLRLIEDDEWLRRLLRRLSDRHEAGRPEPWRMQDLPEAYMRGMLRGIIGLDITVIRLEGKYKLSQNRPTADRPRIAAALEAGGDADAVAIAQLMREREPGVA